MRVLAFFYSFILGISWIVPDQLRAYLSSFGLIFIPLLLGFTLTAIFSKFKKSKKLFSIKITSVLEWWMIGLISLTIISSFFSIFLPTLTFMLGEIIILFAIMFCVIFGKRAISSQLIVTKKTIFSLIMLMVGVVLPFLYWRQLTNFPLMLGDDMFNHLVDISSVSQGTRGIALYDDAFIVLIKISSAISGSKPLWMFWSAPLIQYASLATGIYFLSRKINIGYLSSIFAAITPLWFMGPGSINDLIFFLRRNILMALVPFFMLYLLSDRKKNETKSGYYFLIALIIPIFFYFAVSSAFYVSTISKLHIFFQYLIQPGFALTSPAVTFNMAIARIQDLYALIICCIILIFISKHNSLKQDNLIFSWAIVSLASFAINYRMGFLFSIVFLIFLVLKSFSSNYPFLLISIFSLCVVGLTFIGLNLSSVVFLEEISDLLSRIFFQSNSLILSTQQKLDFLFRNYTQFFTFLIFFSVTYSTFSNRKTKTLSIITALMSISLVAYFLPIPNSGRFLVFITPFTILLIIHSIKTMIQNYFTLNTTFKDQVVNLKNKTHIMSKKSKIIKLHFFSKQFSYYMNSEKSFQIIIALLVIILGSLSIMEPYNKSLQNYSSGYGPTGSISSFNQADLMMADWLDNHVSKNTIIISDPATVRILCGLAEIPYTLTGRYYVEGYNTLSIVSGRPDLFRGVLSSLDVNSLETILTLFKNSDQITGINSEDIQIIAIVNNRTTAWVSGSNSYQFANSFITFPGLSLLEKSTFSSELHSVSSYYLAFNLTLPDLMEGYGPELSVVYEDFSEEKITSIMTYYDINNPNYTLSLSGSKSYLVKNIPINWLLDSVETSDNSQIDVKQFENGTILGIDNLIAPQDVVVRWGSSETIGNINWKLVDWGDVWKIGPYSRDDLGFLNFSSSKGFLNLNFEAGVANCYCSIFRRDLNLTSNNELKLIISANATKNTMLAVAVDFADKTRLFAFNNTSPTFFGLSDGFKILERKFELSKSSTIVGFQIFIRSTDGKPCQSFIKYIAQVKN